MTDKDLSPLQLDILNDYYADNAKKLHRVVDRILSKFGGLTYKDTDDFYSLANEVFADVLKNMIANSHLMVFCIRACQTKSCQRLRSGTVRSARRTD